MSGHDAEGAAAVGLLGSLRRLAATGVGIAHTRLQLLANELEEERLRVTRMLVLGAVAALCGFVALLLASLLIVVAFWDTHRIAAIAVLTVLYGAGALAAGLALRACAQERSRLFSASLAELARDRDLLGS